jgi:Mg2+/Co2+ transporter CorB
MDAVVSETPLRAWLAIVLLLAIQALLASTEAAFLSVNRYRLRHNARVGNRSARLAERLLAEPERLFGVILVCKTIVLLITASLTAMVVLRDGAEWQLLPAIAVLAVIILVGGEVVPKSIGSRYADQIALPAAWVMSGLVRLFLPLTALANLISKRLLQLLDGQGEPKVSSEQLRTAASTVVPYSQQRLLGTLLDLESATVEDIMIPRNEIASIDLSDDWDTILDTLRTTPHTRLPVCMGNLDNIVGILHMKKVAHTLARGELTREFIEKLARERDAYFVPEGTTLSMQLHNFRRDRRRIALVVDEYGDIRGLVTLEDILEEIVGEFTSDPGTLHKDIHRDSDGSFVINGAINVRVLNRTLGWGLPTDGPRTLNGLILEMLETIPEPGTTLRIDNLSVEILQVSDNAVKTVRMRPLPEAED